jgi:dTDP-4-dehydrorhamnose reductase
MKKLWVTGASGFLGGHLCPLAQQQGWQVTGTYQHRAIALPGINTVALDLQHTQAVAQFLHQTQPDAVIHTAARSKANDCQQHPDAAYQINVTATAHLAAACAQAQIPFVFTSTDLVFDGTQAPYSESSPPTPVNVYGEQKAAAEAEILSRYPDATVCRLPLLYGAATPTAACFLQGFLQTLRAGKPLNLFVDEFRTPVSATAAAQGLLLALEQSVTGRLHLGGSERLSRYDMGQQMADILDVAADLLQPCRQADVPMAAPRPGDVSLDSSQAFALGYQPPTFAAELRRMKPDL